MFRKKVSISGTDPLEVPTIYKAYVLGLCKGIYPQNMALYMIQYLHFRILNFPLIQSISPYVWSVAIQKNSSVDLAMTLESFDKSSAQRQVVRIQGSGNFWGMDWLASVIPSNVADQLQCLMG